MKRCGYTIDARQLGMMGDAMDNQNYCAEDRENWKVRRSDILLTEIIIVTVIISYWSNFYCYLVLVFVLYIILVVLL